MKKLAILVFLLVAFLHASNFIFEVEQEYPTYLIKFVSHPFTKGHNSTHEYANCEIVYEGETQIYSLVNNEQLRLAGLSPVHVVKMPQSMEHLVKPKGPVPEIVEVFGTDMNRMWKKVSQMCQKHYREEYKEEGTENDVVKRIHFSGPPSNRIDIVFMGDGYTAAEEKKHDEDMLRLYKDMFEGNTFKSYLPLFNAWSVFRPSAESGIGYYSKPKNTAYGLYREGTELRGVYTSKPAAARDACRKTGPDACDFPTIIGNDPYYGGLGGEFAISTSSETSGTIVLRHEHGHNMGKIGEEYDAGWYFGQNYASSLSAAKNQWGQWITGPLQRQNSAVRLNGYPWYDLAKGPYRMTFTSNGKYKRWFLRFTVSGCETQDSLEVTLDGKPLPWKTTGNLDRGFYEFFGDSGFSAGTHVLEFKQLTPPKQWIRQLCNVGLIEYMDEDEFKFDNDYINAYPNYGPSGGFRSQNERCLMRNMTSDQFCDVCKENLWVQFLRRVNLIDSVNATRTGADQVHVKTTVIPLAQFRKGGAMPGEKYYIEWTKDGRRIYDLDGKFEFTDSLSKSVGNWQVKVIYENTKEVRVNKGQFSFTKNFSIRI